MKKILSIALVALLATSAVFAGFSGNASVALGYNWETGAYGFSNGTGFDLELDLATAEAEAVAEGSVYAGIKANFAVKVANWEGNKEAFGTIWADGEKYGLGLFLSLDEAYVAGENWKVSITGTQGAPDFAKSAIDFKDGDVKDIFGNKYDTKDVAVSYKVASNKAPGVTLTAFDWTASAGFNGNSKDKTFNYNAFVKTPLFDFDVVNFQIAAIASRDMTNDDVTKRFDSAIGASAKVGFDADVVTGSVASDYGVKLVKVADKVNATHGIDVAANLAISPVTVDLFYMNEDLSNVAKKEGDALLAANTLSAQVKFDLADFNVPVAVTAYAKDMLDKTEGQDFGGKVNVTIDAFSVMAKAGYVLSTTKLYVGTEVGYKHDLFAVKAGADWSMKTNTEKSNVLSVKASVESNALIPGATLSLSYGKAKSAMNLLKQENAAPQNFGKVEAKCKIAF